MPNRRTKLPVPSSAFSCQILDATTKGKFPLLRQAFYKTGAGRTKRDRFVIFSGFVERGLANCRVEKRRALCRSIGFRCIRPFELCGKEPSDRAYVSSSPSKIPYGGFSPVRLQTGYQPWRPSPAGRSAVSARHASAPDYHRLIRHHSPSAGAPMVLSDKKTGAIARTLQSSGPWLASGL